MARLLGGLNVLEERFLRWEEGRRQSFYFYEASVPLTLAPFLGAQEAWGL